MINNNQIAFSHRPRVGISVGVYVEGDTAYLAAAFRNPSDPFNRRLSRTIVASRINSAVQSDDEIRFTEALPANGTDALGIINNFRRQFKPDPEECDSVFEIVSEFGGVETRTPFSRDQAWDKLQDIFSEAITLSLKIPQ